MKHDEIMHSPKKKLVWLSSLVLITLVMIGLGGVTRLTGSGLSIVHWNLIQGILPPLNSAEWEEVFKDYQAFPEFKKVNFFMNLNDFKQIFYFEYFHRLLGRIIGLLTIIPFIYFGIKKQLVSKEKLHFTLLFLLVSAQGALGWYMVKSGLVNNPSVSHYRLASHFLLALLFLAYCMILAVNYIKFNSSKIKKHHPLLQKFTTTTTVNLALGILLIQLFYGALTAGLDAGFVSSTYPKMFGIWIPSHLFDTPFPSILFENIFFINFFHRHLGIITSIVLLAISISVLFIYKDYFKWIGFVLLLLSLLQPLIGILNIIYQVPIFLASLHQMIAVLIFQCLFFIRLRIKSTNLSSSY